MHAFRVLKPGFFTTIQDQGRYGYLQYGVPISGAMDSFSLTAANFLVGNDSKEACLETTLIGPELQALTDTQIAITGGTSSPRIEDRLVPMWQTLSINESDTLSFGKMENGCRSYISIRGGIDTLKILGSRSTCVRGGFGGIDGRQLKAGDTLRSVDAPLLKKTCRLTDRLIPRFKDHYTVHVIMGPQADMFTVGGVDTFLKNQFEVSLEADRMGYRLEGPAIEHKSKADIVSDALLPGAIQVPKSGKPVVVMRDAQTTGGYSKIAAVVSSDISMLGQARPRDRIEFYEVHVEEAYKRLQEHRQTLNALEESLIETGYV